jgi:hypothetical protein
VENSHAPSFRLADLASASSGGGIKTCSPSQANMQHVESTNDVTELDPGLRRRLSRATTPGSRAAPENPPQKALPQYPVFPSADSKKEKEQDREPTHAFPTAVIAVVLAAFAIATGVPTFGHIRLSFPPLRLILELSAGVSIAGGLNALLGTLSWLGLLNRGMLFTCVLLAALLPLPYLIPTHLMVYAMPRVSCALMLWVGVWKGLDVAGGTSPLRSSPNKCAGGGGGGGGRPLLDHLVWFVLPPEYKPDKPRCEVFSQLALVRSALALLVCRCVGVCALATGGALLFSRPEHHATYAYTRGTTAAGSGESSIELGPYPSSFADGARMYFDVWAVFFFLAVTTDSSRLLHALLGYGPTTLFRDPLTRSTSPSDFWGRRWNLLIHKLFGRCLFRPLLARGFPPVVGAAAAFVASGLFHEYIALVGLPSTSLRIGTLGYNLAFFALQAPIITAEKLLLNRIRPAFGGTAGPALSPGSGWSHLLRTAGPVLLTTWLLVPGAPLFMAPLHASGALGEMYLMVPHLSR